MVREAKSKFRSIKRKIRKGFHGRRPAELQKKRDDRQCTHDAPRPSSSSLQVLDDKAPFSSLSPCKENVSVKKLLNSRFEKIEREQGVLTREKAKHIGAASSLKVQRAVGFKLQDAVLLNECISTAAVCSLCRSAGSNLQLYQRNDEREGLSESLFLRCSSCSLETPLHTSNRVGGKGGGAHEVNRRSVLASHQFGHAGLVHFCAGMNLSPPVTKKAYSKHLIQIEKAVMANAESCMQEAAQRLFQKISVETPRDLEKINGQLVANVSVTVDGTWQKRGHSSKTGVVFVISVDTGEVLDYNVKSLICYECKARNAMNKESDEYKTWKDAHVCQRNHYGSSEEMEAAAAIEIFSRSIEQRNLKYSTFVGDGDSSCFGRVKEAMRERYGDNYLVCKEECVGHVQKRLGSALRKYKAGMKGKKLSDGKGVSGRGRLSDKLIDKMQNYYGNPIRQNKGDLKSMKNSIKAIQHHMIINESLPLEKQHMYCPKDGNSWCKFWRDKLEGSSTYDDSKRLPEVFMEELDPIFTKLSKDDLLSRCLKGMTQNQNEAINGQLWSKCSKAKFCGARKARIATCETIMVFNTGAASKAVTMELCQITPGVNSMKAFRQQDRSRIKSTSQKISSKYRKQRQCLRAQKKSKGDESAYQSGGFGLSSLPDKCGARKRKLSKKPLERQKNKSASPEKVEVVFVQSEIEVIAPKCLRAI